jgi:hypothetical protein
MGGGELSLIGAFVAAETGQASPPDFPPQNILFGPVVGDGGGRRRQFGPGPVLPGFGSIVFQHSELRTCVPSLHWQLLSDIFHIIPQRMDVADLSMSIADAKGRVYQSLCHKLLIFRNLQFQLAIHAHDKGHGKRAKLPPKGVILTQTACL